MTCDRKRVILSETFNVKRRACPEQREGIFVRGTK
jgi:hypothetical protein